MSDLILIVILALIGAVERTHAGAAWAAERRTYIERYVRLLEVSAPHEIRAAKPRPPKDPATPEQIRPVAEGL